MRYLLIIIICYATIFCTGCNKRLDTVYVPVATCPKPPSTPKFQSSVKLLPKDATVDQQLEALRTDILLLNNYLKSCNIIVDSYRSME